MKINPRVVEYNSTEKLVFCTIYMSEEPNPLPVKSDNIPDLRKGYDFEVGSLLIISSTQKCLMSNGDGTWSEWTGGEEEQNG